MLPQTELRAFSAHEPQRMISAKRVHTLLEERRAAIRDLRGELKRERRQAGRRAARLRRLLH